MAAKNIKDNNISGFYYDIQLNNAFTMCSLHPNMKTEDGGLTWSTADNLDDEGYSKKALCRSILTEDFNVAISNQWSDFGGDPLGEIWNQVKPMAPYAKTVLAGLNEMRAQQETLKETDPNAYAKVNNSKFARFLENVVTNITDMANKDSQGNKVTNPGESAVVDYLNRALVVQGTRFSYYNGTGVSFGNLSMKFTLFPKWEDGTFYTVNHQLNVLYPYIVGKFVKEDKLPADLKDFVGWQKPPGGFVADLKNVDNVQQGTLKLKLGSYYSLTNLVCQDATFNFSKQMVKNPLASAQDFTEQFQEKEVTDDKTKEKHIVLESAGKAGPGASSIFSPLFCDVNLTLRPATKYSDDALRKFATGMGRTEDITDENSKMDARLKDREAKLKALYM